MRPVSQAQPAISTRLRAPSLCWMLAMWLFTVLSEMMAGMAIRRRALNEAGDWLGNEFLFYERTPTKREIDFVSDYLGGAAVEGKYVQRNKWRSEAVTVNASAWKGIITTMNVLDCSEEHSEAWAVPGAFFSFLVDT